MTSSDFIYQIKVYLRHSDPLIWRRILVPASISLAQLHIVLQAVMGWENYHLHVFKINGQEFGYPQDDEFGGRGTLDEHDYTLAQAGLQVGTQFEYIYDFGDGWVHDLDVEAIHLEDDQKPLPRCTGGEQAAPPEDVGGIDGYYRYLKALNERRHPQHKEWLAWRGPFDPRKFDLHSVNARLYWLSNDDGASKVGIGDIQVLDLVLAYYPSLTRWASRLDNELISIAEGLPLRRDMTVLLTYLRDNKVTGTQAAGNLPLKAAKEISSSFVHPPVWQMELGSFIDRVRSSADVWSIYLLMVLAEVGGLISGGPSRRFRFTRTGVEFLAAPAALQVWYLLAVWWTRVNWLIAFPYVGTPDVFPFAFNQSVGDQLLRMPVGDDILFEPFADSLCADNRLAWQSENPARSQERLRSMIKKSVIDPLVDFGILNPSYHTETHKWGESKTLLSFQVTRFGRCYLESLNNPGMWVDV